MAFSILTWALGWSAGKLANAISDGFKGDVFVKELDDAVDAWIKSTPQIHQTLPEAIFNWYDEQAGPVSARARLKNEIQAGNVPSKDLWVDTLKERFMEVKANGKTEDALQPLFRLTIEEATTLFQHLAGRFHKVAITNDKLFKLSVDNKLDQLLEVKSVRTVLYNAADYFHNKRVLYLEYIVEERYPLTAMTSSVNEIRQKLDEIIPAMPVESEERQWARKMQQACIDFNSKISELPLEVRQNASRQLNYLNWDHQQMIMNTLLLFRGKFVVPMLRLFAKHKVSVPEGILMGIPAIKSVHIPAVVYYYDIPADGGYIKIQGMVTR